MKRLLLSGAVVALCVLAGCRKPGPSPQYAEAQGSYDIAIARMGDDAFFDPEMERIKTLLSQVSPKSTDVAAAQALRAKIDTETARAKKEREDRAAGAAAMNRPLRVDVPPLPVEPAPQPAAAPPPVNVDPVVDAGEGGPSFAAGAPFQPVQAKFGTCLQQNGELRIQGDGPRGGVVTRYDLKDLQGCINSLPQLKGSMLLVRDGKIVQISPVTAIEQVYDYPDGGSGKTPPPSPSAPVKN